MVSKDFVKTMKIVHDLTKRYKLISFIARNRQPFCQIHSGTMFSTFFRGWGAPLNITIEKTAKKYVTDEKLIKFNAKNRQNRSFSWTREGGVVYLQKTLCRSFPSSFPAFGDLFLSTLFRSALASLIFSRIIRISVALRRIFLIFSPKTDNWPTNQNIK